MGQTESRTRSYDFCGRTLAIREDTDTVGALVGGKPLSHATWTGAIFLSKVLEARHWSAGGGDGALVGRRVLEVGSGTGLTACVCALLGAQVTLEV